MATPTSESLYGVFFSLQDPRQRQGSAWPGGDPDDYCLQPAGCTDTLVEIKFWAKQKQDWLQQHLRLPHGIPSHDTVGRDC
jgi:hypothetical protein